MATHRVTSDTGMSRGVHCARGPGAGGGDTQELGGVCKVCNVWCDVRCILQSVQCAV